MREPEQSGGWVERRRTERYEQGDTPLPIVGAALLRVWQVNG
jgi:hypothetical protein